MQYAYTCVSNLSLTYKLIACNAPKSDISLQPYSIGISLLKRYVYSHSNIIDDDGIILVVNINLNFNVNSSV